MNRKVKCNTPVLPDPKMLEFLHANRIDPALTPADQEMLVTEEHITFIEFLADESGTRLQIAYNENGDPYRPKQTRTVPLLSDPENHGVEVYNV